MKVLEEKPFLEKTGWFLLGAFSPKSFDPELDPLASQQNPQKNLHENSQRSNSLKTKKNGKLFFLAFSSFFFGRSFFFLLFHLQFVNTHFGQTDRTVALGPTFR